MRTTEQELENCELNIFFWQARKVRGLLGWFCPLWNQYCERKVQENVVRLIRVLHKRNFHIHRRNQIRRVK